MQLKQLQDSMRPVTSHVQSVFTVQQACTTAEALHGADAASEIKYLLLCCIAHREWMLCPWYTS